jgi:hypothetical protein
MAISPPIFSIASRPSFLLNNLVQRAQYFHYTILQVTLILSELFRMTAVSTRLKRYIPHRLPLVVCSILPAADTQANPSQIPLQKSQDTSWKTEWLPPLKSMNHTFNI